MSLWPFEDYEYRCTEHQEYLPCHECHAIAERERQQKEHEDSICRQKRKLKILADRGLQGSK